MDFRHGTPPASFGHVPVISENTKCGGCEARPSHESLKLQRKLQIPTQLQRSGLLRPGHPLPCRPPPSRRSSGRFKISVANGAFRAGGPLVHSRTGLSTLSWNRSGRNRPDRHADSATAGTPKSQRGLAHPR
ncbi:hypothetical protein FH063_002684 [Azospirillum argentinense]|uniref:Uncharacterized protein n=1 Tax=Azospirillum argentinense TaxID=2970906 RepID=A0A5B0KPA8_9PROT|nr:hypothetical protein FH063_002684 [Azospirillum argentinense]